MKRIELFATIDLWSFFEKSGSGVSLSEWFVVDFEATLEAELRSLLSDFAVRCFVAQGDTNGVVSILGLDLTDPMQQATHKKILDRFDVVVEDAAKAAKSSVSV